MDAIYQFAGRLHPLILHAPIGLLIGLVALEALGLARRRPLTRETRAPLAWLAALSAAVAVATGLILENEGYAEETVQLHKWLAIGVGVATLAAAVMQQVGRTALYATCLVIAAGVLVPAGHFGASMTHGADFLTEPFAPQKDPVFVSMPVTATPGTGTYDGVIAPILEARCAGCHGIDRDKGGLRLHTAAAIMAGGEMGPVLVAGNAEASDLIRRMRLPIDDEDHMPPKSKPQPSAEEIAAIESWILAGASFTGGAAPTTTIAAEAPGDATGPASAAAIEAIRAKLVHVEPVSRGSNLLLIDASAVAPSIDDAALASLLGPVRAQVADLTIARTRITDASLELIADLPNLRRLNLSATPVTDVGVAHLTGHPVLEELVLTQTGVTDSSYDTLASLAALKRVYLWKSAVTPETIAELREELTGAVVDAGDTPAAAALPDAPTASTPAPDKDAIAAAVAAALKPVNASCPVSGKPIDPKFAIVHESRVIGFCCEHCLAEFAADPAKFAAKVPTP